MGFEVRVSGCGVQVQVKSRVADCRFGFFYRVAGCKFGFGIYVDDEGAEEGSSEFRNLRSRVSGSDLRLSGLGVQVSGCKLQLRGWDVRR